MSNSLIPADYFPNIQGQPEVKKKLAFYLDVYKASKFFPPSIFIARHGAGKTTFARSVGRSLFDPNSPAINKSFYEINGSSLKSVPYFVNNIVIPLIQGNNLTLFIDEIHSAEKEVTEWMLSMLLLDDTNISRAAHGQNDFEFDFTKFTFLCATTNPEKLSLPFLARTKRIELDHYSSNDLLSILNYRCNKFNLKLHDGIENEIINVARNSPRGVVNLFKDILNYSKSLDSLDFGKFEWESLKDNLNVRALGLENIEISLLKFLKDHGPSTLTKIAHALQLDVQTVRRDSESFLLGHGLIEIDGKRSITKRGTEVLKEVLA